ncbi:2-dehydropantoate 2-reductase [Clostridium algifaecis]|uniref:2-dehydropantoate 2-reductase n=1 Tax=Clostridium algifaecis TaxID=1472040 RepID=A0ABS4KPM8_9CLOT|nr:ketopantoate reductase family protein [Clostridium algifaecis]MBP2031987.1 2-dehydropantoate 2-reductase [Clostridium algifaecis]
MVKKIKNVSIIGMGAIGCAYVSEISNNIDDVNIRIIAEGERAERYKKDGFIINGKKYFYHVVDPDEKCEVADLLIFSVKFDHLDEAIQQVKNHVGKDTIILSLLNGITSEEIIGKVYGMEKVLYSISVGVGAVRENNEVMFKTFENIGCIYFGEKNNDVISEKVLAAQDFFDRAKIKYQVPKDMIKMLWWKLMVNVGVNQTSAVLKANYRVFQDQSAAREIMEGAMREVILISKKAEVNLDEQDMNDWMKILNKLSPIVKTSMFQDVQARRKTEIDIFGGAVVKLGKKYNVATPINATLYNIIKVIETLY